MITYSQQENHLIIQDSNLNEELLIPKLDTDELTKIEGQKLLNLKHWEKRSIGLVSNSVNYKNDVYMNGSLARTDYTIGSTQGQSIVAKLEADWSDEVVTYSNNQHNLVSEFTPLREPYTNESISWYSFEEPTDAIKADYSLTYSEYQPWYGLKFDKTTEEVMSKIVVTKEGLLSVYPTILDNVNLPSFWDFTFFARIHKKDGSVDPYFDAYQYCTEDLMKEWCEEHGYTFPYNISLNIRNKLLIWGITINSSTNEIAYIKAYTKEDL